MLLKARNGSVLDLGAIMIVLSVIVVGLLFANYLSSQFFGKDSPLYEMMNKTKEGQKTIQEVDKTFSVFDWGIVFIFVGIYITAIILAYKMTTETYFLPFAFILVIIFTWVASVISNALTDLVMSSTELMSSAEKMSMAFLLMNKLPYLIFFGGMFLIVVLYIGGGEGGYGEGYME